MGRIRNTISLAKSSLAVLKADKELVALPILSAVATAVIVFSFLAPLGFLRGVDSVNAAEWVILLAVYLIAAFVTIFFNTALIYAANERLAGGDPTIGSAVAGAMRHLPQVFGWALVSATVSLVLRQLQERSGLVGQIVIGFVGMAWAVVTFLVIPVYVVEDIGVVDAVKRSAALFKRTWGENLAAQVGFGLVGFLASLPLIVVAVLALSVGGAVGFAGVAAAVIGLILVSIVMAALNGIFQAALYHYAVAGEVPGQFFDEQDLRSAFRAR